MSLSDDRYDDLIRKAIGWPLPPAAPSSDAGIVASLRELLADLRRRRARLAK